MFANVKSKLKVGKDKEPKAESPRALRKANRKFYEEHAEEFKFFVKYYPVFQSIAIAVGKEEITKLNTNKPCVFRKESDIPFRCKCEICANDGTEIKTIKMCKECKASKRE